ncbi:hypothetical protein CEXT_197531 [Caerostris extrusa]|uniref:Uncharacterized protein n=1 Tax=Caerostris extrusa TaxID=172846 RepID=A0AAV4Y617_CAEEX|nr:hypothetical protein CEXT_197531 [Caerostris extrusa]
MFATKEPVHEALSLENVEASSNLNIIIKFSISTFTISIGLTVSKKARGKGLDGENTRELFHFHNSRQAQRPLATDGPLPYNQTIAQHSEKPVAPESTASRARREIAVNQPSHLVHTGWQTW